MLNEITTLINEKVSGAGASVNVQEIGTSSISVSGEHIHATIELLKNNDKFSFNGLEVISGVDFLEYMEVNYMLCNFVPGQNRQVMIKVKVEGRVDPKLDSIVDLFAAADFQEREVYDMFGISFNNHPDHRRILCPDDWEGFPLRKDYVAPKVYNGMEVYPDSKMNLEDREFILKKNIEYKDRVTQGNDIESELHHK
jgi:NADH-quinone oxidoreductase subunit C